MGLKVNFIGKRLLPNKFKYEICGSILTGLAGRIGKDYYLHFEVMDYNRGIFTGFVAVGKEFHRRVKRFRVNVVQWPDSGRPFSYRDEFYKLLPEEIFRG